MKYTFFKKLIFGCLLILIGATSSKAQDVAKPDLKDATILCDKEDVSIMSFDGPGTELKEADTGCLKDVEEKNTTWFTWEAKVGDDPFQQQLLNFTIEPNQIGDQFGFVLFRLPNGPTDGTGKAAARCAYPCQTGSLGLRDGEGKVIINEADCATLSNSFMSPLIMTPGTFYGLMIENTTSNGGFTISFGGNGQFVGPEGQITTDAPDFCFGDEITFSENITFANGNIDQYQWVFDANNPMGGTGPITITKETQDFTFQSNGTKTVELIVTTDIGCKATFETSVDINDCCDSSNGITIEDNEDITQVACPSDANGAIDITVTNNNEANFPTMYKWSNQATTEDLTMLSSDSYSITVSNAAGCRDSATYDLEIPGALSATEGPLVPPSCGGIMDGSIEIKATGGRTPYRFDLNNNGNFGTDSIFTGLGIGDYTVVVEDASGCTDTVQAIELDEKQLNITFGTPVDPTCNKLPLGFVDNGSIEITADNAAPGPLTFDFNDNLGPMDAASLTRLDSGIYTIDVFDSEGCTGNPVDFTLTEPPLLTLRVDNSRFDGGISCTGANDGTAVAIPSGGTPNYTYEWSTNSTEKDIANLGPGIYTVTVTDDNGCVSEASTQPFVDPEPLTATITTTNDVSCSTEMDGSFILDVNGGTMPYKYTLDGNTFETGTTIPNLAVGDYPITVTDNNDCPVPVSGTIESPASLSFDVSSDTDICYGETLQFTNTSTFTRGVINDVSWNIGGVDVVGAVGTPVTASFTTIGKPTVTLTVMTDLGCPETLTRELDIAVIPCCTETNGIDNGIYPTDSPFQPTCNGGSDGGIDLFILDAAPPTSVMWKNGSTDENRSGLTAGTYEVTITNNATCDTSFSVIVGEPTLITPSLTIEEPTCNEASNGKITITATGGTIGANSNYEFDFNNGDDFTATNTLDDLSVGVFNNIRVRDDNDCRVSIDTFLAVPDGFSPITASLNVTPPSCEDATNGVITVMATGDGRPLFYDFGSGPIRDENILPNLGVGPQSVTVSDLDDCMVPLNTILTVDPDAMPVQAMLDIVEPSCGGLTDGSITVLPSGELGTDISNYMFDFGNGFTASNISDNLGNGAVSVNVRNANNCSIPFPLDTFLNELVLTSVQLGATRPTCSGFSDGTILVEVPNPGEGPFMYNLIDGNGFQGETALMGLSEGTYNIQIQDDNLCLSDTLDVVVSPTAPLTLSLEKTDISCFGENDGRIVATVTGGVGNYAYEWNDGQTSSVATGLPEGAYTLDVTDGNDCPISSDNAENIIEPAELSAEASPMNALCFGEMNGAITVNPIGGSEPYTYSLDGIIFQDNANFDNLFAGTYNVIVKDNRECEIMAPEANIGEPGEFTVDALVDTETTKLGFPINLSAEANTTATGGISYTWSTPDSIVCTNCERFETVPPGSTIYTVNALNSDNCQASASVSVAVSTDRPIYFPNLFTPNGDGVHDEFFIPFSPAMEEVRELKIFDRTGALVFEAFNIKRGEELNKSWDGEFNGSKLRQGVYVVIAQIVFVDNQILPYQSDITIITSQ